MSVDSDYKYNDSNLKTYRYLFAMCRYEWNMFSSFRRFGAMAVVLALFEVSTGVA